MKFKTKPELANIITMILILFFLLFTCGIWIYFQEYFKAIIFFIIILCIFHIYFFTTYTLKKGYLLVHLGIIPIKYNYKRIKKVSLYGKKVRISFDRYNMDIYVENKKKFISELNKKI